MRKPKLPKKVTSTFATVEISLGRADIQRFIESDHKIPFTLHGYLIPGRANVGNSDDVGTEFAAHVDSISIQTPTFVALDRCGRPWAMASDVKAGDMLQCDGGFTCMRDGAKKVVKADGDKRYVACRDGRHYLKGQENNDGALIGLYKVA